MYHKIIFCNCGGEVIDEKIKKQADDLLSNIDANKLELNDLCGLCASNKEDIKEIFTDNAQILIMACHPRAVKLLLEYSGQNSFDHISFLNLRDSDANESLNILKSLTGNNSKKTASTEISTDSDWQPWYPVLDYSRCTNCGQCADFCLFGVYQKTENKVKVANPQACKNNCPACARICPHVAIVFPKYKHGGAISGSETFDETEEQKRQISDMETILGGDIYKALEQRKNKRQSMIKTDAMKKAIEERDMALNANNIK